MIREILSFGAVALGGGYLAKRYWDKKKAEVEREKEQGKTDALYRVESDIICFLMQFYGLERWCVNTHKDLVNLADKISALGDFGESLELFKTYFAYEEKYDLFHFIVRGEDEEYQTSFANQARIMVERLSEIRMYLKDKEMWLDEIAQSLSESRESSESDSGESNESPKSSGKSLSVQTKSEIVAFIEIMKAIYALITENFVDETKFRYDKLVEAKNVLNALKSHPSGGQ